MSKKEQPIIVGLDIGTTKVVAIAGRKNEFGKVEILGLGRADSAGVSHGVVMNIEQCIRSVEQAIERCLLSNPNLELKEVYVGIAGQHIKSLQTRGDRVRTNTDSEICKDDIDLLIRDQYKTYIPAGDQIIDIVPQDFTVDNTPYVVDPIGMSGVKIGANFHVITGDRNAIRNIKRCVDKAQLITRDLVLQPLASAASVMNDEDLEAGVAIVDIGGGTTDMAVFYDGILKHTAVIPYAGMNMKVQFGMALAEQANNNAYITIPGLRGLPAKEISVKNLAHIIEARTHEILDYVVYHLRQINLEKKLYGGIILTGGGAQLKHITQLTEFVTGLGARIGYPNEHLAGGYNESLMNPMYSTCIGLILRGYHDFETGKLRFVGEGGNYMHIPSDRTALIISDTVIDEEMIACPIMPQEEIQEAVQRQVNTRNENVKKLFDGLKGKFMKMFEDMDDHEIN
jgi:cell division protein FtsA